MRAWLVLHPWFGPSIVAWERHRAIPRRAKRLAFAAMAGCLVLSPALSAPLAAVAVQAICLGLVAVLSATRPDGPGS